MIPAASPNPAQPDTDSRLRPSWTSDSPESGRSPLREREPVKAAHPATEAGRSLSLSPKQVWPSLSPIPALRPVSSISCGRISAASPRQVWTSPHTISSRKPPSSIPADSPQSGRAEPPLGHSPQRIQKSPLGRSLTSLPIRAPKSPQLSNAASPKETQPSPTEEHPPPRTHPILATSPNQMISSPTLGAPLAGFSRHQERTGLRGPTP